MKGPLVDNEGFPRADIDVYAVRVARNKAISEWVGYMCVCVPLNIPMLGGGVAVLGGGVAVLGGGVAVLGGGVAVLGAGLLC